jgi:hypothetical protein
MRTKLTALMACLLTMVFLAGCNEGSSGSAGLFDFNFGGSSGGDEIVVSSLPSGSSDSSSGSSEPASGPANQPEPATFALLGSGLLAYALFRRKKKK